MVLGVGFDFCLLFDFCFCFPICFGFFVLEYKFFAVGSFFIGIIKEEGGGCGRGEKTSGLLLSLGGESNSVVLSILPSLLQAVADVAQMGVLVLLLLFLIKA